MYCNQPQSLPDFVEIFGSAVAAPLGTADLPGNRTIEIGRYVIVFQCLDPARALFRASVPYVLIPIPAI